MTINQHKYASRVVTAIFCCSLMTACKKDYLDRSPKDVYTDQTFWTTSKDVTAAINGCYLNWESADNILYNDCYTDNALYATAFSGGPFALNYENFTNGSLTASTNNNRPNLYSYQAIYACNWFLENVDRAGDNIVTPALKTRMKAEARFLRAYRYFILTQFYRDVPFVLHTMTLTESRLQKQVKRDIVRDAIIKELALIAPDLPVSYPGQEDIGRVTRGAALALKARIELFSNKYDDCIATCNQLMTAPFNYELYANYEDLFRPQIENSPTNREVMLDIQYKLGYNVKQALSGYAIAPVGGSTVAVTQSLVDEFETLNGKTIQEDASYNPLQPYMNRDRRLDATIIRPGLFYNGIYFDPITPSNAGSGGPFGGGGGPFGGGGGPIGGGGGPIGGGSANGYSLNPSNYKGDMGNSITGYNFKKYLSNLNDYWNTPYGATTLQGTGGNVIVIRYAEVLLTYAEAKIEAGQIDASVYNAINKLRQRAGLPNATAVTHPDQASLRTLVRRERRVELAGEGLRWFDIVRWQIGPQVIKNVYDCLNGTVDRTNGNLMLMPNSSTVVRARQFSTRYYVFPFAPSELQENTNLVQNTEYR
ncbi:RagB/SusD family nutrient uptake outer membrane protein [Chitinophaga eiseniae]|uniref:RagB/SusD family nutrient uptake outer membrane protein n=1 Tax=Chitinophaga eiseniae TaxID=634771 RepID=A0A847S9D8_9BACT|nr:RagB/SusD family nutrient uptake outer membrane protein [Chitinophaga eiseniae]NLR78411.1 RagB/SusD family nutrient uptake outer membrane protein [Chitinophaga eiseniae]